MGRVEKSHLLTSVCSSWTDDKNELRLLFSALPILSQNSLAHKTAFYLLEFYNRKFFAFDGLYNEPTINGFTESEWIYFLLNLASKKNLSLYTGSNIQGLSENLRDADKFNPEYYTLDPNIAIFHANKYPQSCPVVISFDISEILKDETIFRTIGTREWCFLPYIYTAPPLIREHPRLINGIYRTKT